MHCGPSGVGLAISKDRRNTLAAVLMAGFGRIISLDKVLCSNLVHYPTQEPCLSPNRRIKDQDQGRLFLIEVEG